MDKIEEFFKANKLEEALSLCNERLCADSENVELLMYSGRINQKMGERRLATNAYLKVLNIEPDHSEARTAFQMIKGIMDYYCKDMVNP
ncbi:MAG: hypothetical protein WBG43_10170 [Marinifilaceae bacterium]